MEKVHDEVARFRVESAGGLVRQQNGRVVRHGTGNGHALVLPAGEFVRLMVRTVFHADHGEEVHRPRPPFF